MTPEVTRRLHLLGPVCVELIHKTHKHSAGGGKNGSNDREIPRFRSRRTIGLLGYLVAERRPIARETLSTLFWPDEPTSEGRANLRRELHNLSQILPGCWEVDRHVVAFVPHTDTSVDIYTLEKLKNDKRWVEAVELLGGEFLEGVYLEGNPEFENWLLGERKHWGEISQTIFTRVIEGNVHRGRYAEALQYTQRQLQLAPWNENAHQGAMRLLAWTGQRGAALRQFETCKQALRDELDVEPTPETIDLCLQIQEGKLTPPQQLPAFLTTEKARHEYTAQPFVGRKDEINKLNQFFEQALDGKSQVVFVSGGPGRGKTVLLEAFAQQAMEMHPELLVSRGNGNAYSGVGDPYLPFRDIFAMLTGDVEERWDAGAITREHATRIWDAFSMIFEVLLEKGPHLLDVFVPAEGLSSRAMMVGEEQTPSMTKLKELIHLYRQGGKEVEQSHLFQQATSVLTHVAKNRPLLLILDDLQWGDTATISLLFHLGRRLAKTKSKLMIACAYRPEEISMGIRSPGSGEVTRHPLAQVLSEFKRTSGDIWVDLGRIDHTADRRFLDALVDIEPNRLDKEFRTLLFGRTRGHPLFTLELMRTMQQRGELVKDKDGLWIDGPELDWDILPARVEAVIGERLDRLDPGLQEILATASVEGEVFTAQVVAEVNKVPVRSILRRLSHDLEHQYLLVTEQEEVDTGRSRLSRYKFSHILFQDYLYRHLGQGERRLLHGAVAAAQETLYQGLLDDLAVGLANHYYLAQDYERAFHYFCMAGDRATRLYESREAILHYTMAINLIEQCSPDSNYIAKLIRGRGLAYDRLGDFKKASVDYRQTLQLAINADDQKTAWQANIDLGKLWTSRDYNQARMYYETALEISRSLDQPGLIASSLNWMGNWHANNENPLEGVKNHQEALHLLEELGDNRALANTLDLLALANMLVGDLHATVEYYDRAIPLFRDLEDQPRLASSLIGRASTTVSLIWLTAVFTNTPKEAIINVQEGLSIAGEIGLTSEEAWGNYSMGLLNLIQGDFGRAQEYIESGLMVASEVSHREYEVGSRFAYAAFYMTLLSPWQALDHIKVAMKQAVELCSPTWINLTAGAMTAVYLMLGDNSEAEACLDRVKLVEKPMNTLGRRYCWVQLARLALSKDDPALALDIADRLIESIPGVSPEGVVTSLLMIRGNALAALGQATEAEQAYQAAINNIETTGERYVLWRIRGDLYQLYQAIGCQEAAEAELSLASVQIEELATSIPDENLTDGFRQGAYKTLKMDIPPILSKRSGKL